MDKNRTRQYVEDLFCRMEENTNYNSEDIVPKRMIIFIFVEDNVDGIHQTEECADIIKRLEKSRENWVHDNCVYYNYYVKGTLVDEVARIREEAGKARCVHSANEIIFIPVILREMLQTDKILKMMEEDCKQVQLLINEQNLDTVWQPIVLLGSNRPNKNILSQKNCLQAVEHLVQAIREMKMATCNNICIITSQEANGHLVTRNSQIKTLFMVSLINAQKVQLMGNASLGSSVKAYTAKAFTITEPVHMMLIEQWKNQIQILFKQSAGDMKQLEFMFGKQLAELPKKLWWSDSWQKLPIDSNGCVNTIPIWSNMMVGDNFANRKQLQNFVKEYYLDHISFPADGERINEFKQIFFRTWFDCNGSFLKMVEFIRNTPKRIQFVSEKIERIKVTTSGRESDNGGVGTYQLLALEEKELVNILETRIKELYLQLLGDNSELMRDLRKNVDDIEDDIRELNRIFEEKYRESSGDEMDVNKNVQCGRITQDVWERLVDVFVNLLANGNQEKYFLTLCNTAYHMVIGTNSGPENYMKDLLDKMNRPNFPYEDFENNIYRKLMFPANINAGSSEAASDFFVFAGELNGLPRRLSEGLKRRNTRNRSTVYDMNFNDRIELVRISTEVPIDDVSSLSCGKEF